MPTAQDPVRANAFLLLAQTVAPQAAAVETMRVLPNDIAGYVSLLLGIFALVGMAVAWGKWIGQLNGYGGRLKIVEDEQRAAQGRDSQTALQIERMLGQHDSLIQMMGGFSRSAEQCSIDTEKLGKDIAQRIDGLALHMNKVELNVSQRLAGVEKEIELTRRYAVSRSGGNADA